jgi:hypothetical protein
MTRPYVSIDIETTGLNEDTCQVLSVGAVIDDWKSSIDDLPRFHCYVGQQVITGSPYALSMHPKILRAIAEGVSEDEEGDTPAVIHPDDMAGEFENWLSFNRIATYEKKIVVAGKNFGAFDHQFLKRLPNWRSMIRMKHRFIDPGNLYYNPTIDEDGLPDMETCMARAGILGEVSHTALEDALMVVRLIRYWAVHRHMMPAHVSLESSTGGFPNGS